jgi:hypothetical protein
MLLDDAKAGPLTAAQFSVVMLVWTTGGKQFTVGELDTLLRRAGFTDVQARHSYGYFSLVSARKP